MDASKFRRTVSIIASAVLIASLTAATIAAPAAAAPSEEQAAAKQARAEVRAAAKAARQAAKEARAQARAEARAARQAAKEARAQARAEAKAARRATNGNGTDRVTICHKPGTPAEGTREVSASALQAHLDHGDNEGTCELTSTETLPDCEEQGTLDTEACSEPQPVLVSIEAPESIASQDALTLNGDVSGLDESDLTYAWSSTCLTDEELTDPAFIASEPSTIDLIVREDTLPPGTMCDFTLRVIDEDTRAHGSATVTVEVLTAADPAPQPAS